MHIKSQARHIPAFATIFLQTPALTYILVHENLGVQFLLNVAYPPQGCRTLQNRLRQLKGLDC